MSAQHIPTHDSKLWIDDETTADDIIEYTAERLAEPAVVGDVVVWNFNSHDLDAQALINADLPEGSYVVPYQVPGAWGFMVEVLPSPIDTATLLTYRQTSGEYNTYENHRDGEYDERHVKALFADRLRQVEVSAGVFDGE